MNDLLRRWTELEPQAPTTPWGAGDGTDQVWAAPGEPDDPEGQGLLLHALWEVIEARGWRWVMLFAPGEDGTPPYLARVTADPADEGRTRRGKTPAHALLAGYVALLEHQSGGSRTQRH